MGNLLGLFQLGTLPAADTRRNLELFATEVMPRLRATLRCRRGGGHRCDGGAGGDRRDAS